MKKRPFLGALTVLLAIPSLLLLVYFAAQYKPPLAHWFVLEKVVISVSSVIGGVLLWRGSVWGYRISVIAWGLAVISSLASLVSLYQASAQSGITESLQTIWMSKDVVYIFIASPVLYILAHDIFIRTEQKRSSAVDR